MLDWIVKKDKYLHYKIKMNQLARGNIEWWKTCLHSHNSIVRFPTQWDIDGTHQVWTDASDVAGGAMYNDEWFCISFLCDKAWCKNMSIGFRELYIVIKAVKTFGKLKTNIKVTLHIDNQAVCHCVNNASSKNDEWMELITELYYILVEYNMEFQAVYVTSAYNIIADAISRYGFHRFRLVHPNANINMVSTSDINYFGMEISLLQK